MASPVSAKQPPLIAEPVIEVGPLHFKSGTQHHFVLMSDVHFDNKHCDRKLLKRHLDHARKLNAGIFITGDLACVMQSKNDRRQSKKELTERLSVDDYFDEVNEELLEFFEPYKDLLIRVSDGNHETAAENHCGTNPSKRFVRDLRKSGAAVRYGTYGGWTQFRCVINRSKGFTLNMHHHHGAGGGGEATDGYMIAKRMAVYIPDAHIAHSGHVHSKWIAYVARDRINSAGTTSEDEHKHVCTPGYKREYAARQGFHTERRRPPKPVGSALLTLFMAPGDSDAARVSYEITWMP